MSDAPLPSLITILTALGAVTLLSCDAQSGSSWAPPEPLDAAVGSINSVEIAMNADGDAIAVWSSRVEPGFDARDYSVWAARFTPRSGWGTATKLGSADGRQGASQPAIAVNDEGQAVVAWEEWASDDDDQSAEGVWVTRFDPETQWEAPVLLGAAGYSATVALNDNGQAVVAWTRRDEGVWVSLLDSDSRRSAPERLDRDCIQREDSGDDPFVSYAPSQSRNPEVAMADSGQAVVIWDDNENEASALANCDDQMSLRASHYAPDGGWTGPTKLGVRSAPFGTLHAALAFDQAGRALAGSQEGKLSSYTESSGWSSIDLGVDDRFASVAMAKSGHAIAVWETSDRNQQPESIRAIQFSPEEGWGEPVVFSGGAERSPTDNPAAKSPTILDSASADVAVNDAGDSLVVWHQVGLPTVRSSFDVWANHYTSGRGWSTPTALSVSGTIEALGPRVVVDSMGRGIAVWQQAEVSDHSRDTVRLMWSRFE